MKLPAPAAAVIAKIDALELHPALYGGIIALGGILLIAVGLRRHPAGE